MNQPITFPLAQHNPKRITKDQTQTKIGEEFRSNLSTRRNPAWSKNLVSCSQAYTDKPQSSQSP